MQGLAAPIRRAPQVARRYHVVLLDRKLTSGLPADWEPQAQRHMWAPAVGIPYAKAEVAAMAGANVGYDRTQLFSMAKRARSATGENQLTVVADRGYFKDEEIGGLRACRWRIRGMRPFACEVQSWPL